MVTPIYETYVLKCPWKCRLVSWGLSTQIIHTPAASQNNPCPPGQGHQCLRPRHDPSVIPVTDQWRARNPCAITHLPLLLDAPAPLPCLGENRSHPTFAGCIMGLVRLRAAPRGGEESEGLWVLFAGGRSRGRVRPPPPPPPPITIMIRGPITSPAANFDSTPRPSGTPCTRTSSGST